MLLFKALVIHYSYSQHYNIMRVIHMVIGLCNPFINVARNPIYCDNNTLAHDNEHYLINSFFVLIRNIQIIFPIQ